MSVLDPFIEAQIADSPVAAWPLDDSSGTVARDVLGQRHGVYRHAVQLAAPGRDLSRRAVGYASGADPATWVELPSNGLISAAQEYTIEMWFYQRGRPPLGSTTDGSFRGATNYANLTNATGAAPNPFWLREFNMAGVGIVPQIRVSSAAPHVDIAAETPISENVWTLLTVSYRHRGPGNDITGRATHIYMDGKEVSWRYTTGDETSTNPFTMPSQPLRLAAIVNGTTDVATNWSGSGNCLGRNWGLAFWDYMLPPDRVAAHYAAGEPIRGVMFDRLPGLNPADQRGAAIFRSDLNGRMSVADAPDLRLTGDCWVMGLIEPVRVDRRQVLLTKREGNAGYELGINANGFLYWTSGGQTATDTTQLFAGSLVQLMVIVTGDQIEFLIDGELTSSLPVRPPTPSTAPLLFGADRDLTGGYDGKMQEWAMGAGAPF